MISTLVIGGSGFVGSHLIPQLVSTGRDVTVLARNPLPRCELPSNVNYIQGNFSQAGLIGSLLDRHDEVVHLAYASVPNTSFDNPLGDLLQNLPPTVQLFSEAAARGVKLLLVSSGGTVYGEAKGLPIQEIHPKNPISPYGVTKLTLENYAYLYSITHGLKFVCIRPSNAYGIGQKPFVGQGFIATAIASAMRGLPINIFGERGTVRDYIYVSDLASGIVSALQYGHLSESYNLSSGVGLSNLEVIEKLRPLMLEIGCNLELEFLPERKFDVKTNVLDSSKLHTDTGWKPVVDFNLGLNMTCDWLRKQSR